MEAEIEAFRSAFSTVLTNTARMTGELTDTAQSLASIARAAGAQSDEAASTARGDLGKRPDRGDGCDSQLGESVQAINSQLADATTIVQRASGMAEAANQTIGGSPAPHSRSMRWSASSGPSPAKPICWRSTPRSKPRAPERRAGICGRRLGSQGTGDQTAKATEEISSQITEVQSATRQAVDNVGAIALIIGDIDGFHGTIAAAVSQQNAAAGEISRNIGQAAAGTALVARSIAGTAEASENANRTADMVLATAHDLSGQATQLRSSVDRFLSNVAA